MEEHRPMVFLQSLEDPEVCFLTMPVRAVDAGYRLELGEADRELLGLARRPRIGREALCLVIVTVDATRITANLLAPVVVNLSNRRGAQAILAESEYSHQHVLAEEEVPVCS
jgi:flagellar assembly factor FliW